MTGGSTTASSFTIFLKRMFKCLDTNEPSWKHNTIILLDNASYHKTPAVRDFFRIKGVKLMYSAPYSFRAVPVERFFALVK